MQCAGTDRCWSLGTSQRLGWLLQGRVKWLGWEPHITMIKTGNLERDPLREKKIYIKIRNAERRDKYAVLTDRNGRQEKIWQIKA